MLGTLASFASFVFSLTLGLTTSLMTMALAWLFYRPCLSLSLLGAAGLGIYLAVYWDGTAPTYIV